MPKLKCCQESYEEIEMRIPDLVFAACLTALTMQSALQAAARTDGATMILAVASGVVLGLLYATKRAHPRPAEVRSDGPQDRLHRF